MEFTKAKSQTGGKTAEAAFAVFTDQPGAVWLDSSETRGDWGHTSYIATDPLNELILRDNLTTIRSADGHITEDKRDRFFAELDAVHRHPSRKAVGFISYEAALPWLGVKPGAHSPTVPDAHFYVYDRWQEFAPERDCGSGDMKAESAPCTVTESMPRDEYLERVNRIKWHIHEGDIYQANFTCRFDVSSKADPFAVYRRLRELNPACYSAFMNFGKYQILSSSPERLLLKNGEQITSTPIKGTIGIGNSPEETAANRARLLASAKDRAELLMIVDLVRNDLGRVAATGSVAVDSLFRTEIYSSLIHLMADVSAQIEAGLSLTDILAAMLPGGSITGAPKKRAVEIINELETVPRSVYTGCIGHVGGGRADFNIAIRTLTHNDGTYQIHAGGGIVADSDPEAEYNEMCLKARNLFKAVGVHL